MLAVLLGSPVLVLQAGHLPLQAQLPHASPGPVRGADPSVTSAVKLRERSPWVLGQVRPPQRSPAMPGTVDRGRRLYRGVTWIQRQTSQPRRNTINVIKIDLTDPDIRFQVTEPQRQGPGETIAEPTPTYLKRIGAQVGINTSFFRGLLRQFPYIPFSGRLYTRIVSFAATAGNVYSPWERGFLHGINISPTNEVSLIRGMPGENQSQPAVPIYHAVAGNLGLVEAGQNRVAHLNLAGVEPRSAIALTQDRHLLLFVVDGRQPGYSSGMTYTEVADALIEFGAWQGISLDGGSSSTLATCPTPAFCELLNRPSNGFAMPVGNNLAVFAAPLP